MGKTLKLIKHSFKMPKTLYIGEPNLFFENDISDIQSGKFFKFRKKQNWVSNVIIKEEADTSLIKIEIFLAKNYDLLNLFNNAKKMQKHHSEYHLISITENILCLVLDNYVTNFKFDTNGCVAGITDVKYRNKTEGYKLLIELSTTIYSFKEVCNAMLWLSDNLTSIPQELKIKHRCIEQKII